MNDRTAMVVTVMGSHVVMGAVLLTATTVLIGTVNAKLDRLEETVPDRLPDHRAPGASSSRNRASRSPAAVSHVCRRRYSPMRC